MRKNLSNVLVFTLIILTIFNFNIIIDSINLAFKTCINTLIPSLIPFLLISSIIIKKNLLNCSMYTLNTLSFISGSPSNSKFIKEYIDNGVITSEDGQKVLNYMQYVNPLYILNGIGLITLNNKKLGLIILISNLLSSLMLKVYNKEIKVNKITTNDESLFSTLTYSIKDIINTLLYVIGVITCFFIITTYISIIFNIKEEYKFVYGIFEITQGINYLSKSNLNIYFKTIISSFFVSFGGLSIHMQIYGILDNKKIRYKPYLISRIIHSIISIIITSILFYILN